MPSSGDKSTFEPLGGLFVYCGDEVCSGRRLSVPDSLLLSALFVFFMRFINYVEKVEEFVCHMYIR